MGMVVCLPLRPNDAARQHMHLQFRNRDLLKWQGTSNKEMSIIQIELPTYCTAPL